MNDAIIISKETIKRIINDIKVITKTPLTDHGIYYIHDDTDLLKGKALIIGPKNTPYENGYYLFEFIFPSNYPYSPPKLIYYTNDGNTRFNPNLYKCGKVCLSILNTWRGEQWTSCQTITTILLTLCTTLNETPILNEPGITKNHEDYFNYHNILKYKNLEFAVLMILKNETIMKKFNEFSPIMKQHFIDNYNNNMNTIDKEIKYLSSSLTLPKHASNYIISTNIYHMTINIDYPELKIKFNDYYENINLK